MSDTSPKKNLEEDIAVLYKNGRKTAKSPKANLCLNVALSALELK